MFLPNCSTFLQFTVSETPKSAEMAQSYLVVVRLRRDAGCIPKKTVGGTSESQATRMPLRPTALAMGCLPLVGAWLLKKAPTCQSL